MNQKELDKELFKGVETGNLAEVEIALQKGADTEAQGIGVDGGTALIYASEKGHTEIARLLLQYGAKVNTIENSFREEWTALIMAASEGHKDIVKLLLSVSGVEINIQDADGDTALIVAVLRNQSSSVKLLLEAGADTQIKAIGGETALSVARNEELSEIVELIEAVIAQKEMDASGSREESIASVMAGR